MGLGISAGSWTEGPDALVSTLLGALVFWLLGAAVGLCLPRPKWMGPGLSSSTVTLNTPAGVFLRRFSLAFQGAYIVREIWYHFTSPGTFHALLNALAGLFSGQGWHFVPPQRPHKLRKLKHKKSGEGRHEKGSPDAFNWYITEADLEFFKERTEREGEVKGAGPWEHMVTKDFGSFTYEAWRRWLSDGKTEYKSVTVAEDSTAEEFMDFYLDDDTRTKWDAMISAHESLESGDGGRRCQVVRWERTFPFSFLSKREYVIGRRMFRGPDGCLYGITKGIEHPRAPAQRDIVRMDVFWSMWRSRTIPCPHGSGRPACETVLLHHEQFKIPENLARFAVRHGMTGFVKKMGPAVREFVACRRRRISPFEDDPEAYGAQGVPNPPSLPASRAGSVASTLSDMGTEDTASDAGSSLAESPLQRSYSTRSRRRVLHGKDEEAAEARRRGPMRRLARINGALIAAGVAFALGRSSSQARLA